MLAIYKLGVVNGWIEFTERWRRMRYLSKLSIMVVVRLKVQSKFLFAQWWHESVLKRLLIPIGEYGQEYFKSCLSMQRTLCTAPRFRLRISALMITAFIILVFMKLCFSPQLILAYVSSATQSIAQSFSLTLFAALATSSSKNPILASLCSLYHSMRQGEVDPA